jgi:hypothetical protein
MGLRRFLLPVTLFFAVLLLISSITAPRESAVRDAAPPQFGRPAPPDRSGGRDREATMPEDATVDLSGGDLLELTVVSEERGTVQVEALGEVEPVAPDAPARFTFYASRPGTYVVRMLDTDEVLGEIVVAGPEDRPRAAPTIEA